MTSTKTSSSISLSEGEIERLKDFSFEIRVRYSDTDMSGHPHHSKYFIWLEEARHAFLRELGLSYREMEEEGLFFPVVEAKCKYLATVRMDEIIEIRPRVLKATRRYFRLIYTITTQGEDAQKVAEAETMNIAVNADRMIISLPQKYLGLLKVVLQIQEVQANG